MSKIFETPLYAYKRHADQDAQTPVRHPVIVVGAGPVGLATAIDLAM
jgi:3-(3-hydroxy-phenyl)propionate hydroxylase